MSYQHSNPVYIFIKKNTLCVGFLELLAISHTSSVYVTACLAEGNSD